ncbi:MAG: hypothetical protein WBC38_04290 [Microgenomates group bacterium]
MKRLLMIMLAVFLIADVFLAIVLFKPVSFSQVMSPRDQARVKVISSLPGVTVSISNSSYLNDKLQALEFWKEGRVRHYEKDAVGRVTVKSLILNFTEKSQSWGQRADSKSGEEILYSYGQLFDRTTGTMTLYIHVNPLFKPELPLSQRYSGVILFSLFDLVQPYPVTDDAVYSQKAKALLNDIVKNPTDNNFVKLK